MAEQKTQIRRFLEDNDLYYWSLSKRTMRGRPFTIVPPLKPLYRDPTQEIYIEKAAQVFISEYLINLSLFLAATKWAERGNVLYIFPATPQISDFSMARIEPVIIASKYLTTLRNKVKDVEGGTTVKNVALKRIGDGYIYLRGSNRRTQLISVDADGVIYDELDEMEDGTVPAGKARTGSSLSPIYRGASTPKYPRRGIDAFINKSDNKKWLVKCQRCNTEVDLAKVHDLIFRIPEKASLLVVDPSDIGTYSHIGDRYYVGCPSCQQALNVWNGRWVASRTENVDFGGYHIPKLISDRLDFNQLAKRVEDDREGRLSEKATQEFYNSDLGLPRAPQGSQLALGDFIRCTEGVPEDFVFNILQHESFYNFKSPLSATYMGVDVSPKTLHIIIIGFPSHNPELRSIINNADNSPPILLYAGTHRVDPQGKGFPELDSYLHRWNVSRCVIDVRPETMNAREFCRRNSGRSFAAEYVSWKNKANFIYKYNLDERRVSLGRTETLDVVFSYILKSQLILPTNVQYIGGNINASGNGEFISNFMNLTKITDMEKEEAVYDDGGNADHFAHATNYAFTAARISELSGEETFRHVPKQVSDSIDAIRTGEYRENLFANLGFGSIRRGQGGISNSQTSGFRRPTPTKARTGGY